MIMSKICISILVKYRAKLPYSKLTIDSSHDESDLSGIRRACEMCVDLFRFMLVQADESVQDVVASRWVVIAILIIREVVLHWTDWKLLLESINLVEEKNYRRLDEPPGIANRIEQGKRFLHTVDRLIFEKELIVLGNGDEE